MNRERERSEKTKKGKKKRTRRKNGRTEAGRRKGGSWQKFWEGYRIEKRNQAGWRDDEDEQDRLKEERERTREEWRRKTERKGVCFEDERTQKQRKKEREAKTKLRRWKIEAEAREKKQQKQEQQENRNRRNADKQKRKEKEPLSGTTATATSSTARRSCPVCFPMPLSSSFFFCSPSPLFTLQNSGEWINSLSTVHVACEQWITAPLFFWPSPKWLGPVRPSPN